MCAPSMQGGVTLGETDRQGGGHHPGMKPSLFALVSLTLIACAAEPAVDADPSEASALVAPRDGKSRRPAPPRACEDFQQASHRLVDRYQVCSDDVDCTIEPVRASCLAGFLCPVAVAVDADVERLSREAAGLSLAYRRSSCGEQCPVARCASPESTHAFCDPETKRCRSVVRLPDRDGEPTHDADSTAR